MLIKNFEKVNRAELIRRINGLKVNSFEVSEIDSKIELDKVNKEILEKIKKGERVSLFMIKG
ncbi:hypothetical protein EB155_05520 [archaeon]|nr:hypothetical protein [archaeon]NDB79308.1 hypothetical protein [archaeon]